MALDKLVDSSKLDACCTAEANAIRAKTGSSAQIAYDWANSKGFADAIAAISGGGSADTVTASVTPGADSGTITITAGSFVLGTKYLVLITSDVTGPDTTNEYLVNVAHIKAVQTFAIANNTYYRYCASYKANDSNKTGYTSKAVTVTQSGTDISIAVSGMKFWAGKTYTATIYNLSADI